MLDIEIVRDNKDKVIKALCGRNYTTEESEKLVSGLLLLDIERRELLKNVESLRKERNDASAQVAKLKRENKDASELIERTRKIGDEAAIIDRKLAETEPEIRELMLNIPNIPHIDVPLGKGAEDNVVVREWGEKRKFSFTPKPHWEIGENSLSILDMKRGAQLAGSNFPLFVGAGARLARALINLMLETHREANFIEISPPVITNRETMTGTGQLPKFEDDMYRLERDDLFLIPTAEVPIGSMHRGEILSFADLPLRYCAYTPCFRREAGTYGRDTRGLLRVHQFDKVEMFCFTDENKSYEEHELLVSQAEKILQLVELPYRVLALCTGEIGFSAAKCYDIELYSPGVDKWLEVSSVSNCESFQARNLNIRYRDEARKTHYVHTLNGSGVALARLMVSIIENYQNEDGSVTVPQVLRESLHQDKITPADNR
ncbi:MAG: serine--tRNA ligase [Planctomycetota bacterium]